MKLQSPDHQRQPEGKVGATRRLADKIKNIIHLHEVVPPDTQMKRNKAFGLLCPQKTAPEENSDAIEKLIFDDIVYSVNQGNFKRAEQLREMLLVEAPKAFREIVRSGELIEEKKTASMNPGKIRPWADLFNQFTNNEAMAFYFALKEFVVKPNQPVFQQGNCDNRLYLITAGSLKLKYFDYDARKNVQIATLRKGDIAGVETFFTLTNHTTNLIAIEESTISYLDKAAYQKILAENHTIESKLLKFCDSKQIKYEQPCPESMARRAHKRYKADLNGDVQRFDQNDRLCEEITKVKIIDISAGGLAYRVRNLKIGEAAHLHNSRIHITASYQKYSVLYELKRSAKVVSLKFLPYGECSVHVQFEETMDENTVMEIARHTDVVAYI